MAVKVDIYTALDMTYGLLNSISVQGYSNVRSLYAAISNINDIMDWLKKDEEKQKEEAKPHDADDGQGQDV